MDLTLLAILGGIGVVLLAFRFLMSHYAKKEREKDPPVEAKSRPKGEYKRLVLSALQSGEPVAAVNEPLTMDEDCQEIWAGLPGELTSFVSQHGKVSWESGGYVGGRIYRVSNDKALTKFLKKHDYDTSGLVIGADEAERFFVMPGQGKIFCASEFLDRVDSFEHIFELVVSCADIE